MNFTLIAHEAGYSYYDRCGNIDTHSDKFEIRYSTDQTEFAEQWASVQNAGEWDDLIILLNGKPESEWTDEEQEAYDELDRIMYTILVRYQTEDAKAREEKKLRDEEEKERARLIANEKQRLADLAQLEALKKKLGVQ